MRPGPGWKKIIMTAISMAPTGKKCMTSYSVYLPYLNNRADLRLLMNDLLGELNSSHQGFSSNGSEETKTCATAPWKRVLFLIMMIRIK